MKSTLRISADSLSNLQHMKIVTRRTTEFRKEPQRKYMNNLSSGYNPGVLF